MNSIAIVNVLAIILSPVIAIGITRLMETRRDKYRQKFYIFSTLLSLRHYKLDAEVIRAMNTIEVLLPLSRQLETPGESTVALRWTM